MGDSVNHDNNKVVRSHIAKPPEIPEITGKSVFLAGSIEMGKATEWQSIVESSLSHLPVTIMNPRRIEWDSTWVQSPDNPPFRRQVQWEMDCLDRCDVIAMYFDPAAKAPISLLELGLHAKDGKMVVCCPEGFWRRGNVQMVCERYGVEMVGDIDGLVAKVKERLYTL